VEDLNGQPRSAEGLPATASDAMNQTKPSAAGSINPVNIQSVQHSTVRAEQLLKQPLYVCMYVCIVQFPVPSFPQSAAPRELVPRAAPTEAGWSRMDHGWITDGTQVEAFVRTDVPATSHSPLSGAARPPSFCLGSRATWKAKSRNPPIGAVPNLPACLPACLPPRCNGSQSRC
jgi:hypothetical protein